MIDWASKNNILHGIFADRNIMKFKKSSRGITIVWQDFPPIYIHYGTPLIPLAMTFTFLEKMTIFGFTISFFITMGCILSILLHELGHSFAAKRIGIKTELIRLLPIGGEAVLASRPTKRSDYRLILVAGPLTNLVISTLCFLCVWAFQDSVDSSAGPEYLTSGSFTGSAIFALAAIKSLTWIGWFNFALAIVNMLPAFPLDGGRIARSLIAQRWGNRKALLLVGSSGVFLSAIATVVFFASTLAAMPVWSPPYMGPNLAALRKARTLR